MAVQSLAYATWKFPSNFLASCVSGTTNFIIFPSFANGFGSELRRLDGVLKLSLEQSMAFNLMPAKTCLGQIHSFWL